MKNKLLREKINCLLVIITSYSIFCLSILNASAQTLGSAHRDYVNSTNSNVDGHTASSQWRVHDRANTGNFAEDLKQEWQNLCDSFNFLYCLCLANLFSPRQPVGLLSVAESISLRHSSFVWKSVVFYGAGTSR